MGLKTPGIPMSKMADKLNDEKISSELKRFGETIKIPIDVKRRPILIKKLNHHYAKENPPLKRNKSSSKRSKRTIALAEFSDDSQDESNIDKSYSRNSANNDSYTRESRSRNIGNTSVLEVTPETSGHAFKINSFMRNKRQSTVQKVELHPNEFSDTEGESVYIEEQSVGVNTTLNYDTADDSDVQIFNARSKKKTFDNNLSSISTLSNATFNKNGIVKKDVSKTMHQLEHEHFIPKTILIVMSLFFLILATSYIYLTSDMLFTREALKQPAITDLKETVIEENGKAYIYQNYNITIAHSVLRDLYEDLATKKGKWELGEIGADEKRMTKPEIEKRYDRHIIHKENKTELLLLCFRLILKHTDWNILAFDEKGASTELSNEVMQLESRYGNLSLVSRIILSLYKVLYGLALFFMCLCFVLLGIYYLRWQNKKKEKEKQKVYELVEKIIEILKDNIELAEKKNDPKNYPHYMAVQHIRDQLIPVSERHRMKSLWNAAVQFIESNESRIRVETQMIQGEEFTVWRWLQSVPNGHKVWQGQAFGEMNQNNANSLTYGPTPCLKIRNMFDANIENVDDWHLDIKESILEKCQGNNGILHIYVDKTSKEGCVYIKCSSCKKAYETYQALHGWWFDGRLVTVKYLRLEHYHEKFPDSQNRVYPLLPTKKEMPSMSRPYHRSALEMT